MHLKIGSRVVIQTYERASELSTRVEYPTPTIAVIKSILRPRSGISLAIRGYERVYRKRISFDPEHLTTADELTTVTLLIEGVTKHGRMTEWSADHYRELTEDGYNLGLNRILGLAPSIYRSQAKTRTTTRGPLTIRTRKYVLSSHAIT